MSQTHFPSLPILYILILYFIVVTNSAAQSPDANAMFDLKKNLIFAKVLWTNQDPCQWENVQCTNGNVISIKIGRMGIKGTIHQSINQLKNLQIFDVNRNHLTGPLPTFAGMSSLKILLLNNNRFSKIPDDFFKGMASLETVSLDLNPFEQWPIPASLAEAVELKSFSAVSTNIIGKIPNFFGSSTGLAKLSSLHLSFNYLKGELPVEFSNSLIQSLWLDRQLSQAKLSGPIDVLSNMTSLVDVWLHYNHFEDVIPNVSMLTKLEDFCVNDNKLFGPVPESLTGSPSLKIVNLSNNLFQGKMPKFRDKVEVDNVGNSNYCSNSPDVECDQKVKDLWKIVEKLKMPPKHFKNWDGNDVCNWNGIACDNTRKNVNVISFQNMNLKGEIPPEFTNFASLERLYLQRNNLVGTFPAKFGSMSNLVLIDVSYNQIIDNLPMFRSRALVHGALKKLLSKSFMKNISKRKSFMKNISKRKSLLKKKPFKKILKKKSDKNKWKKSDKNKWKKSGKKWKKGKGKNKKYGNDFEMPEMDIPEMNIHC